MIKSLEKRLSYINGTTKHLLHCALLLFFITAFEISSGGIKTRKRSSNGIDPFDSYGVVSAIALYVLRLSPLVMLPTTIFNFLGLTVYNCFPGRVKLKNSVSKATFICVRIVTRGDFPELVKNNVVRNINTCLSVGLKNFVVEVVTDKIIDIPKNSHSREIIVPVTYRTKSGSLFKARALQYCLEDDVNTLNDNDWIVHLDEETLLTEDSVTGILNFIDEGRYQFGQGVVTFANEKIVNWITTLADNIRVAIDVGLIRFQLKMFHKPLFAWKGSFIVALVQAERKISFDHGLESSLAENCFFGLMAYRKGYEFNFVEGEMWETSPFTIWDFIQQRKQMMQGIYLAVSNLKIPMQFKILMGFTYCELVVLPLITLNYIFAALYPIPCWQTIDFLGGFVGAVNTYLYLLGAFKSFSIFNQSFLNFILRIVASMCVIPIIVVIENIAVVWGLFRAEYKFYVVKKGM